MKLCRAVSCLAEGHCTTRQIMQWQFECLTEHKHTRSNRSASAQLNTDTRSDRSASARLNTDTHGVTAVQVLCWTQTHMEWPQIKCWTEHRHTWSDRI